MLTYRYDVLFNNLKLGGFKGKKFTRFHYNVFMSDEQDKNYVQFKIRIVVETKQFSKILNRKEKKTNFKKVENFGNAYFISTNTEKKIYWSQQNIYLIQVNYLSRSSFT